MKRGALLAAYLGIAGLAAAGDVTFTAPPVAVAEGGQVKITFAVSAPTDVEVAILDSQGRIVRHLAAGFLGKNAPTPFKPDSLEQAITWDGNGDDGQVVWPTERKTGTGSDLGRNAEIGASPRLPFKVRVSAGLRAEYAGTAFGSEAKPNEMTNVVGLAAAPDGRVYVLSERWNRAWWRHTAVHVFRRDGTYEKTVKPFPANLPADRVAALTALRDDAARPIPTIYRVLAIDYYPIEDLAQQMAVTPDGNLHFMGLRASYHNDRESSDRHFATLAPDGGLAYKDYCGPEIPGERAPGDIYLASASDGRAIFATGIERGEGTSGSNRPNLPLVYRIGLPDRSAAAVFYGDGKVVEPLNDPRGIASDGRGRLYVADRGNDRVLVISEKDAAASTSLTVKAPTWVGVHRTSGAVYVASEGAILRFAREGGDGLSLNPTRLELPKLTGREAESTRWSFALDATAERAVLWVGRNRGEPALCRAEEVDGKFSELKQVDYTPARTFWNVATAHDGRTAACKVGWSTLRMVDEVTGESRDVQPSGLTGETYRLGPNAQIYGMDHWRWGVQRWDKTGKKMPFPETMGDTDPAARGRLKNRPSGTTSWERDFDVDRQGNVYTKERGPAYHGRMRVDKYDKDGKFLGTVIWVVSDGAHGPRVDNAGNVYIADTVKPVGETVPRFFEGKLPKTPKIDKRSSAFNQYEWMYGSVMKFGPAGGAIWFPILAENDAYAFTGQAQLPADQPRVKIESCVGDRMQIRPADLQGALWMHYGVSYVLDMHPGHNRRCHCTATEFDVDDYGRVFYTDQGRFRVVVLDTNGNELLAFGRYGNQDSAGELAFNWFTGLGASDRYVYAADGGNRRVLRAALKHAAEAIAEIK